MKLKKHSHEFLPDGKLKVWVTGDIEFTVTVPGDITKEDLDKTIKEEAKKVQAQKDRVKELGIGEEVK